MKILHLIQKIKNIKNIKNIILHKRQFVMYKCCVCDSVFEKTYDNEIDLYFDICPKCKTEFIRNLRGNNMEIKETETYEVMGDIYNSLSKEQQAALDNVIRCLETGDKLSDDNFNTMVILASMDEVKCRNCLLYITSYAYHKRKPNPVTNITDYFKEDN